MSRLSRDSRVARCCTETYTRDEAGDRVETVACRHEPPRSGDHVVAQREAILLGVCFMGGRWAQQRLASGAEVIRPRPGAVTEAKDRFAQQFSHAVPEAGISIFG